MVTAGDGASAPTASTYGRGGGGGGVGGKVSRNQFRRSRTTPYDRPPTARRNPSLLSKLVVDPIRNLASSAAHRFFASVTGKRLTPSLPPPLPPESIQEVGDRLGDVVINNEAGAPEALTVGQNLATADTGGISELEQLLKQKTFTRSEIDRLTELLQSKAVDLPGNQDVNRAEASLSDPMANFEKPLQVQKTPLAENGTLRERSHGVISTPGISARVLEEDVASPAELAKAYMGSRPSKVSPSMLGLRSQAIREEAALLSNAPFTPKSPMISLAPKVTPRLELAENSFASTRSRGRSAIYNMARTPYSRVHTAFSKGREPGRYGNEGYLLASSSFQDQDGEPGSTKLALKRRSSVLDDDLVSGGPMRRIRQKHNLSSQRLNLPSSRGMGGVIQQPLSRTQKLPSADEWEYKGLKVVGENEDNGTPSTSYARVPSKSSEMAARILQQLEKVSPKEKSAESKLITAREKSPAKLTTDMLHGQALRSLEYTNSPKLLQSTQGSQRLENLSQSILTRTHDFAFREKERIEENGPKTIGAQHEIPTPVVNRKDVVHSVDGSDSAAKLVAQRPQKKQAFMMSAHEDSLDLDEETISNGPTSEAVVGRRGKSETSLTIHSSASAEKLVADTTAVLPETKKSPPEPIFGKKADLEIRDSTVGGEKNGVAFPTLQTSSTTSPSVTRSHLTSIFGQPKQENNKIPAAENSPASSVPELSAAKPSFWTQPSPESLSSSGVVVPTLEVPGSDKHDNNKAVEAAGVKEKPENLHSTPSSSPSSTTTSFVVPESLNLKNGPLSVSPSAVLPSPVVASTGFASETLTAGASPFSTSDSVTNFAAAAWSSATSSSSPFGSAGMPIFQFGSSVDPSTAVASTVSTTSDAVPSVGKTDKEKEANAGSLTNTSFGGTSFAMASTGSSIFGLSSSSASSTKSPSDDTASGFMFGDQSSDVGSGTATISQNVPFQFGSSASSTVFGSSGVSSFMSSNPALSSSTPASKLFGSGASFGLSPSTSAVETKSVDSGSGPSSGVFSFGTGASAAASGANSFSSSTPSTFSFGMSSSATSSLTNAVVSSSSTPPAIFNFGASSSSGTGMISSSTGTSSAIFGASTLSSSSETNAASSSRAAPVSFGSSWQSPKSSPFGATSSSAPVFSFGASSSSFATANTAPMILGSSTASATSSGPGFSFTSASSTPSFAPSPFIGAPIFGNSTSTFTASGNNDQMSMEDTMAEDVQAATPSIPVFGQQPVSASPGGFGFGSAVPQSASPFQFGGQQSQGSLQNSSPFQASGSMEFNAGGSFSLGSGGGPTDKSNRRIVKVNRTNKHRKK